MKKQCIECGDEFTGRIDKKFCSDQCRNTYNNNQNKDAINYVRNVNNILRKNRRILSELNPGGKAKVMKSQLAAKGYNFNYHTGIYHTKTGKTYIYCYDYGYFEIEKDYLMLVMKEGYVE